MIFTELLGLSMWVTVLVVGNLSIINSLTKALECIAPNEFTKEWAWLAVYVFWLAIGITLMYGGSL